MTAVDPIRTDEALERALDRFEELLGAEEGTAERAELDSLDALVEDYASVRVRTSNLPERTSTIRAAEVEAREGYRIWISFSDGIEGEVDLSDVAGRGVFEVWEDRTFFEKVHISDYGEVAWGEDLDFCPDALYLEITGLSVEELMPGARSLMQHA